MKKYLILAFLFCAGTVSAQTSTRAGATAATWASFVGPSITNTGTITSGIWNGSIIGGTYGGTGMNNGASTLTIGGNTAFSGAFAFTGTLTAPTTVTFPTSGTLVNTAVTTLSSLASIGTITTGVWNGTALTEAYGGTHQTTYATGDILYGSAANTLSKLTVGGTGTVLTVAGGVPTWANSTGITWTRQTAPFTLPTSGMFGYFTDDATVRLVATLPTAPVAGVTYTLQGTHDHGFGWEIAQPATTIIYVNGTVTTAGATGYITGDPEGSVTIVFDHNDATNNVWYVTTSSGVIVSN